MRVLVAPDKFRGTLSAQAAAHAIATGWLRARPRDEVLELPMADGGEGTLDALTSALGGVRRTVTVSGPLGDPVDADYGIARGPSGDVAVVELARASGLELVAPSRRRPTRASTRGTGQLILAACAEDPHEVIVCIGGSATIDGGAGMAQALGIALLDARGNQIGPGGSALLDLERIDLSGLDPVVRRARFRVASDVDSPLTGPLGAAFVYGPQKGATPEEVLVLDRALGHLAAVILRDLGLDVRDFPGAGAAGGMGAGLLAFLGAHIEAGVEVVIDAVGLREGLRGADVVVSGEGTLDAQSMRGKVPAGVMEAARLAGVPVILACGRVEIRPPGVRTFDLVARFGEDRAMRDSRRALEELAGEIALSEPSLSSGP